MPPRRASRSPSLGGPLLVGGVALGAYLLWSRRAPAAVAVPAPAPVAPRQTTQRPLTLVERLRADARARVLYYVQALWWTYGKTQVRPDGRWGAESGRIMDEIRRYSGVVVASADGRSLDRQVVALANEAVAAGLPAAPRLRVVPDRLPRALIDQINAEAGRLAPGVDILLLQATAA